MTKFSQTLLLLLLTCGYLRAQDSNTISASLIYGSKIYNTKGTYKGLSFGYNFNTINYELDWVRMLNIESINIEAALYDLNDITADSRMAAFDSKFANKGYFGYDAALTGAVDIKLFNINGFKVSFTPDAGLVYSTKNYASTHGVNQILGSHLNAMLGAKLKLAFLIADDAYLNIGTGFNHISNAGTAQPNNSLNRIESFIGITQALSDAGFNNNETEFNSPQSALSIEVIGGYTSAVKQGFYILKEQNLQLDASYRKKTAALGKVSASLSYGHYISEVFGFKVGTDVVYSAKLSPMASTTTDTATFLQTFQGNYTPVGGHFNVGINAGVNLCVGRFVFTPAYGYYLGKYEKYVYNGVDSHFEYSRVFYTTFTAKYFLSPKIALVAKSYLRNFAGLGINMGI